MTDNEKPTGNSGSTVADALDKALNHIAGAHGLIDQVRESARAAAEPDQLLKEIDRVWHALEIAGVLTTQLVRKLERAES